MPKVISTLFIFFLQDGIVKDGLWDVYNQIHMVGNDVSQNIVLTKTKSCKHCLFCIFLYSLISFLCLHTL